MRTPKTPFVTRRACLAGVGGLLLPHAARARGGRPAFAAWVAAFRAKAVARGIAAETYARVMGDVRPDMSTLSAMRHQAEFELQLWQYLNRVTSDWKIARGKEQAKTYAPLLLRIERDFGVEPAFMLGIWGIESAFGDPVVAKNHTHPVFASLAALAWAEPRRRGYWESELIHALEIVQRGWSTPQEMVGSWAGAMGHTQWMPEVWLHIGIDYNHDGKISPFGPPDDALGSTARFLVERGKYRRGEHWGFEVRMPQRLARGGARSFAAWQALGVTRADGEPYPQPNVAARPWLPVPGGPAFLLGANFFAAKSYNPSMNYALGLCHLGDRCVGGAPFVQKFPGSERGPTLAEVQEIQRRLTALGYDTGGSDGRVGSETTLAVAAYQRKIGMHPADGYAGVGLLARLRQGA